MTNSQIANATNPETPTPEEVSRIMAHLGRKGGSRKSARKAKACRENARRPRPRGRKKRKITPETAYSVLIAVLLGVYWYLCTDAGAELILTIFQ